MIPFDNKPRSHPRSVPPPWYYSVTVFVGAFSMCGPPGLAGEPTVILDNIYAMRAK